MDSIWINPGKVKTSDEEGWRGHGVVRSEGGMGNRTHSPELVVACVPIVAHVLIVTRVLVITRVLAVPRVCSCALAVIHEPRWPFWLVVVRALHGSWAMVKGARRWVVVVGCGQRTVAGIVHGRWQSSSPVSFHGRWCSLGL